MNELGMDDMNELGMDEYAAEDIVFNYLPNFWSKYVLVTQKAGYKNQRGKIISIFFIILFYMDNKSLQLKIKFVVVFFRVFIYLSQANLELTL